MNFNKDKTGFTLIELIVVIVIIAILSGIIMFAVGQYINRGKDSSIIGNLAILIPAGEVFYNVGNSYDGFCGSNVVSYAVSQMPQNSNAGCYSEDNRAGVCCYVADDGNSWAACARELTNPNNAYCVDSRGVKKEICNNSCSSNMATICPDDNITNCSS